MITVFIKEYHLLFIKKKIQFQKYMIGLLGFHTVLIVGEFIWQYGINLDGINGGLFYGVLRSFILSFICAIKQLYGNLRSFMIYEQNVAGY